MFAEGKGYDMKLCLCGRPYPPLITAGCSHAHTCAPVVLCHAADSGLNSCLNVRSKPAAFLNK